MCHPLIPAMQDSVPESYLTKTAGRAPTAAPPRWCGQLLARARSEGPVFVCNVKGRPHHSAVVAEYSDFNRLEAPSTDAKCTKLRGQREIGLPPSLSALSAPVYLSQRMDVECVDLAWSSEFFLGLPSLDFPHRAEVISHVF